MTHMTQDDMAGFMRDQAASVPVQVLGSTGQRASTGVWTQGPAAFSGDPLDFHMFELQTNGQHRVKVEYDLETTKREFVIRPGMLSYFQPDCAVRIEADGVGTFQQLWVDRSVFRDVMVSLGKGDPDKQRLLGFVGVFDPVISRAMSQILVETQTPSAAGQMMVDALTQQMAIAVVRRNVDRQPAVERQRALSATELDRAIAFIEDQIEENQGLDALAKSVGMTMFRFSRAFKRTVGMAPHQYLIERRLARAQELLAGTTAPISDIAYGCGFSSQAHMTTVFSNKIGTTPAKYRKTLQT